MLDRIVTHVLARLRHTPRAAVGGVAIGAAVAVMSALVFAGVAEDVVMHDGLTTTDAARLAWVVHHRSGVLIDGARFLDVAGSVAVVGVLAVLASAFLWWRRVPVAAALAPLASVLVAGAAATVLKLVVDRPRPAVSLRLVAETEPSFPSGHATGTMALAVSAAVVVAVYLLRRPLARVLTLAIGVALPILVAASRLELGVHWPTDVVAGLALGASVALVVTACAIWVAGGPASAAHRHPGNAVAVRLRTARPTTR